MLGEEGRGAAGVGGVGVGVGRDGAGLGRRVLPGAGATGVRARRGEDSVGAGAVVRGRNGSKATGGVGGRASSGTLGCRARLYSRQHDGQRHSMTSEPSALR